MGPKEKPSEVLVFRIQADGAKVTGRARPSEVFYCVCTQKVHKEDRAAHKEICHGSGR